MWIVSQFSMHGQGGFVCIVCWLSRPKATVETYVPGPYTLVCICTVGEALIQSEWSLTLTPALLAEKFPKATLYNKLKITMGALTIFRM